MFGNEKLSQLVGKVLENSAEFTKAQGVSAESEVTITAENVALTRFANNIIHQNVAHSNVSVMVRTVVEGLAGLATTNDLSDESLTAASERALTHARQLAVNQTADPDFPGLAEPQPVEPVAAFDAATADLSPEQRARQVGILCSAAASNRLTAAGAYKSVAQELAIANSKGAFVYHAGTSADLQTVMSGDSGSGWAQSSNWRAAKIDAEAVAKEAIQTALRAQNPETVEPGPYTVILASYAVADILQSLNYYGMGAESVQEGSSWMSHRLGEQAMSPLISIWDDGRNLEGSPLPFDFETVPRQRVDIVSQGKVIGPVYDRYAAGKEGRESTGHALPPTMRYFSGSLALNLFMAGGDQTVAEMIAGTKKGLFITRFWYTRVVHPRDCVITGMTRDGVTMIENGRLTRPVKNLRFTQSYIEALANVVAVSRQPKILFNDFAGAVSVPALKIKDFNFTGLTV